MTVTQAARAWGVSRKSVLSWIHNGRLAEGEVMREETPRGAVYWVLRREAPPHRPEAFAPIERPRQLAPGAPRRGGGSAAADDGSAVVEDVGPVEGPTSDTPAPRPRRRIVVR